MKKWLVLLSVMLLTACSLGPSVKPTPAVYDLGAPALSGNGVKSIHVSLLVPAVTAPVWLDTTGIVYRLNYQDAGRQQVYANSQWAASPAALLTQQLRARLVQASSAGVAATSDGVQADYALRVELDDFSQVFDSADSSRVLVTARVSLVGPQRSLLAQKIFALEGKAASADAEGGVHALIAVSNELVTAITAWTASVLEPRARKTP
jgi:cholesterol transport system auxiliary component